MKRKEIAAGKGNAVAVVKETRVGTELEQGEQIDQEAAEVVVQVVADQEGEDSPAVVHYESTRFFLTCN